MKNKDYWYPFYPTRFRRATIHLTNEHRQIYRDLIDYYMETSEPLPDNDTALANIAHVTIDSWTIAKPLVLPFFSQKNGMLYNKFSDENLSHQETRSAERKKSGKLGAKKRWENQEVSSYAIADPMAIDSTLQDTTLHKKESKKERKTVSSGFGSSPEYEFDGAVVKLLAKDYFAWVKQFNFVIDLKGELNGIDIWLQTHPEAQEKWFLRVSQMLNKKNIEAKARGIKPRVNRQVGDVMGFIDRQAKQQETEWLATQAAGVAS